MSEVHTEALVVAPPERVWELVGDPRRYPEWLPRVLDIEGSRVYEGVEFIQVSRQPVFGRREAHFVVDRLDELREIRMHCTVGGTFAHWQLTEAQGNTFVRAEFGMDPQRPSDRLFDAAVGRRFFRRWLSESIDSLKLASEEGDARPGRAASASSSS
jgi:ribosome-associated toxin RatA of RatAB toxin-antitoxin module